MSAWCCFLNVPTTCIVSSHFVYSHFVYSHFIYCQISPTPICSTHAEYMDLLICCIVFYSPSTLFRSFGRGQLSCPHCSWASLLGGLPVLSAHSFASNLQLRFLNQRKGQNGRINFFMTNLHERICFRT